MNHLLKPHICILRTPCLILLDSVRVAVQPTRKSQATEMVPCLPTEGEKEDSEGAGLNNSCEKIQDV